MKRKERRVLAILLAASMLAVMLTGCGSDKDSGKSGSIQNETTIQLESGKTITIDKPTAAESYEALYNTLISVQTEASKIYEISEQLAVTENPQTNPDMDQYGAPDFSHAAESAESVETAELITTDGTNIYMVCSSELVVVSAKGKNTKEIGRTFVTGSIPDGYAGSETPKAIYLQGDSLYIVTYEYLYRSEETADGYQFDNSELVHVKQFDVSNPKKPTLISDYAQSGAYINSYTSNGMLYLIGAYSVWQPSEDDLLSYVPYTVTNGENTVLIPTEQIYLCPGMDSTDYTVISAYDMAAGENANTIAVTGYNVWSKTDGDSLYLGRTSYNYDLSEPYEKDQYAVNDLRYSANTELLRLSLDSNLDILANTCVSGYLYDQSSMDLEGDSLYLATICTGYTCQIFNDEKYGFSNYLPGDRISGTAGYVLDTDLNVLRTAEDLGNGESVCAIRMDGGTAYAIGYESIIPMTQTDLRAEQPKTEKFGASEGVGHFLYHLGDDLLAGIGTERAASGEAIGLNLSIYQTESGVMELLDTVSVTESWNFAMGNSSAILTLPEQNLIAVPTETTYYVYEVQDGAWKLIGTVDMGYVSGNARLLQIGKNLYFCNDAAIVVVKAETMKQIGRCDFAYG